MTGLNFKSNSILWWKENILNECFECSSSPPPLSLPLSSTLLSCSTDLCYIETSTASQDRIESSRVGSCIHFRFDGIFNSTANKPNGLIQSQSQSQSWNSCIHNFTIHLFAVSQPGKSAKKSRGKLRCRFAFCSIFE